jgi:hypothetical protein
MEDSKHNTLIEFYASAPNEYEKILAELIEASTGQIQCYVRGRT